MNFVTLNNGLKMPQLGFGVWQVADDQATSAVARALEVGYTSIDTAMIYKNERGVGKALKESSVSREELFITTKVWNGDKHYIRILRAFLRSHWQLRRSYFLLYELIPS